MCDIRLITKNVPRKGLEPPHLAALAPETSASTNFATSADKSYNSRKNTFSAASKIIITLNFPRSYSLFLFNLLKWQCPGQHMTFQNLVKNLSPLPLIGKNIPNQLPFLIRNKWFYLYLIAQIEPAGAGELI